MLVSVCISGLWAGCESLQTPDSLPLDTPETLLIGPYAAFHLGRSLTLTRASFLSLFLPDSPVALSLSPSTAFCFSPNLPEPPSHFFISNSPSLNPRYLSHISLLLCSSLSIFPSVPLLWLTVEGFS